MFIDILLYNSSSDANKSLNQLTIETLSEHGVSISKQGMDKRFNEQSVEFIKAIFERYLAKQIQESSIDAGWLGHFGHVRIKDGTRFDVPEEFYQSFPGSGGSASKAGICIQYEFDIKSGKILDFTLTAANRPDNRDAKETKLNIEKGDLAIRDLGYFVLGCLTHIIDSKAYLISRLDSKTNVYQQKNGKLKTLDFASIYRYMHRFKLPRLEMEVFVGKTDQLPVRLVIELMPDEVYSKRMQKINKGNKKKGYHTSDEYSKRARFNLFITNIPNDMLPAEAISALYKIRWQIELVFKIWKSTFGINNTRKMKYNRWLCLLYAKLLVIIINWGIIMAHRTAFYNKHGQMLSMDKCYKTLRDNFDKFRKAIQKGAEAVSQTIDWTTKMFIQKHWLEKRKKRTNFEKILYVTFCKSGIYAYI
jgi:hypothetical protein